MLNSQTLDKLKSLKLTGMAKGLEEQLSSSGYDSFDFEERLGLLIDLEVVQRDNRRLKTRLTQAKLKQNASLEDIIYKGRRGLKKSFVQTLHNCNWIKEALNMIITGATGTGKSYLVSAFAHRACLMGYKARYFKASKLFAELQLAKADGRHSKLMNSISKFHLLVIDDWGLSELNEQSRNDLLDIIDDRYGIHSTIIVGQLPVEHWHKMIGNPTIADAILDRIVHNSYKINLEGDSMRKTKSKTK
jgi:DNA replication protein DnaC